MKTDELVCRLDPTKIRCMWCHQYMDKDKIVIRRFGSVLCIDSQKCFEKRHELQKEYERTNR